ncbi:hybrid sensor histidine kinase/response regulator [Comamonas flocculans]|uniref:hybrid sensor histidine kinase/response regulator n=1 Tax=Comamonas flocculans TaxID=2597701 RepID=UPI001648A51B|nr:hybrid sensor histidine kinase/response regulator [Comamonas flocculans]
MLADPALLWRVLGNLLSNALRYTQTGGVMLAVRRARTASGLPAWRFEVRDSGPGIAALHRATVFDEFYRAHDDDRTHLNKGHCLGLAVAQRMAARMGTRVLLHPASERGRGCVFSITLPRADLTATVPAEPAQAAPLQRTMLPPGLHVLVVDDDPAARLALSTLLQGWGVRATICAGLEQAQAALPQTGLADTLHVHGLITDHWLGQGRRSHEVLDWARQRWPGLAAAVVSGGASSQDVDAITRHGARFWRKPLKPDTLHTWLAQLPRS